MKRVLSLPAFLSLALVAGVALVYGQTAHFSLLACDDPSYTTLCPFVKDGISRANVTTAFFGDFCWGGIYMPLVSLTYMLDFTLFGGSPSAMHIVSIVFHALNAVLFFWMLLRLLRACSPRPVFGYGTDAALCFFAAALWALHPLRVESVAWVASRKDVMFTFFTLLGLHAWMTLVMGEKAERPFCSAQWWLAFLWMLCACLSKPTAMCFPFVAVCIEALFVPHVQVSVSFVLRRSLKYAPLVVLAAATGLLATHSQTHSYGTEDAQLYIGTFSWRLQNALVSLGLQLKHLFMPVDLTYYYRPNRDGAPFDAMSGYLSLLTAGLVYWWLFKTFVSLRRGLVLFGIFFMVSIGPTLGVAASFGRQAYADRFTYVPMMAFSLFAVWACTCLPKGALRSLKSRVVMMVALAFLTVACAVASCRYAATFKDELTVSRHVLSVDELNADAMRVVGGAILLEHDDVNTAISYFRDAIAVDPQHQAGLDLIFALRKRGLPEDLAEVERLTQQFKDDPTIDDHGLVIDMLAEDALKKGDENEARRYFEAMARVDNPVFAAKAQAWLNSHPKR